MVPIGTWPKNRDRLGHIVSGVWEESLLVRNPGLAGSMVEELAGAESSHGLGDLHNDIFS